MHAQKVICVGLGRTGTVSLRDALEILGFGPCLHLMQWFQAGRDDIDVDAFNALYRICRGTASKEDMETILRDHGAALDYPVGIAIAELYAAYPDAKYILTVRDPEKWERSIKATILPMLDRFRLVPNDSSELESAVGWGVLLEKFHRGRLATHTQQEFLDHIERVKQVIPSEKLLVYEVGEGWDRLAEFLGVPSPTVPFPHANNTEEYLELMKRVRRGLGANPSQGVRPVFEGVRPVFVG